MNHSAQFSNFSLPRNSLTPQSSHATSGTFNLVTSRPIINVSAMNDGRASEINGLPPHVHELMSHSSAHLLSPNQEILDHGGNGSNKPITRESLEGTISNEHSNMLSSHHGKPSFLDGHRTNSHTKTLTVPAGSGYSYVHASRTRFGDQQSDPYRRNQVQVNYLDCLASRIPTLGSLHGELQVKEKLRVLLTKVAQKALEGHAQKHGYNVGPKIVDLKCIGSLRSGFMLPNTDLDLVVRIHASSFPKPLEKEYPRILEKAFLDAGFGVHLVSKTRISIVKSFEKPLQNPLDALKEDHEGRQNKDTGQSFGVQSGPEFPQSGASVRCDSNFSGRLALYNTELLRCYALCDERVRLVGIFVKMWAKIRKINDPYRGTMCSYGYIIMVIHYLMNVAHPPLVPNLQAAQRSFSGHMEVTSVNGHEIRFFNVECELRAISKHNRSSGNQQSVGELLRGFFAYYGSRNSNSPQGGFDWVNNTVSIRTQGGVISKFDKGWNTAKTDANGNRLRFLIAVEDLFEHEHNVARTVTEAGLGAIRTEFNRAQTIINRIQEIPGFGWEWRTDEGDVGQDFLAEPKDQANLYLTGRFKNPGSRADTGPKHLDCVPELCTARMEDNTSHSFMSKSIGSNGYSSVKTGLLSGRAQSKSLKTSGKDAHADSSRSKQLDQPGYSTRQGCFRVKGKRRESQYLHAISSNSTVNCKGSILVHPTVSAKEENEEVYKEGFEHQANLGAKTMQCLLHIPEAHDVIVSSPKLRPSNQL